MIFPHQQAAIDYITGKLRTEPWALALLLSGSIAHGFNGKDSDVDINIVVADELRAEKAAANALTYYEPADSFYPGGYFDGKYITLDYLALAAEQGSEPTRFALGDCVVLFDKTGEVPGLIKRIGEYGDKRAGDNAPRLLAQLEAWKWYCGEALKRDNAYLLETSVSRLILFAARLILLENRMFFPYHKWLMRVLENAPQKPKGIMEAIYALLGEKSPENIDRLYTMVNTYRDWTEGAPFSWTSHFVHDVETLWMRESEYIENI